MVGYHNIIDMLICSLYFSFFTFILVPFIKSSPLATSLEELPTPSISVTPYSFTLNPDTHQLYTTWEVKGSSISFICAFGEVSLMELSWTGESKELSSGTSWAVNCEEGEQGDKMVIEVDVTKFRVQPFRSYKVCISLEDYITDSYLDEVCTHLFSFEKYVPYVPEEEVGEIMNDKDDVSKDKKSEIIGNHFISPNQEKSEITKIVKSNLNHIKEQLDDIENFVRDDFKQDATDIEEKILEEVNYVLKHSAAESCNISYYILLYMLFLMFLHIII